MKKLNSINFFKIYIYYKIKPFLPRWFQIVFRRIITNSRKIFYKKIWPIDENAGEQPTGWKGWPGNKQFALVLTHDVESIKGYQKIKKIVELEKNLGFRSAFFFVPKKYNVTSESIEYLTSNGFEVGVHGLYHDGKLYSSKKLFQKRVVKINKFLDKWGSVGFRAPAMHHNLDWNCILNIKYDSSTFDTDPFEPQSDRIKSIFPLKYENCCEKNCFCDSKERGYIELPYTLPQDFLLFIILREKNINIWKEKIDWIAKKGGMALIIIHPDYMNFNDEHCKIDEYSYKYYEDFLKYIKEKYENKYWHALPKEIANLEWNSIQYNKKNICMLAYTYYEVDNRVRRYAETLARRGDKVDIISFRMEGEPVFKRLNGVNIYKIQIRRFDEKGKYTYLYRLLKFFIISSFSITKRHFFNNHYDLIHVHSVPDFEVFAALLPKLSGAKVILDIHDLVPEFYISKFISCKHSFIYKILLLLEKLSISFSNYTIIANHIWEQTLLSRAVKKDKCEVFLNYPDKMIFKNDYNKKERMKDKFIMVYPGSLNWHQGIDIAIKALALIKDKIPQVEFHIYGEGTDKEKLIKLTEDFGITDRVFFKDAVPLDKIPEIIINSDLGIVPKRKDSFGNEAFSTKIFEFMLLGVPVLTADTKIDKYYFDDSLVQFFKSGDEYDLAEKMILLIENKDLRDKLALNSLKHIEKYSWNVHKKRYLDLVDRLCNLS